MYCARDRQNHRWSGQVEGEDLAFDPEPLWSDYDGGVSAFPERRPYEVDASTDDAPESGRWLMESARRQPGRVDKGSVRDASKCAAPEGAALDALTNVDDDGFGAEV